MATVSAPSGNVYVFDPVTFTISGSGEFDIIIEGIRSIVSSISDTATFDASGILKSLFTISQLSTGIVKKTISWSITQNGSNISTGSFTAIFGSNKIVKFDGDGRHITLRWITQNGNLVEHEFCVYQDSYKIDNINTAKFGNVTYNISLNKVKKIELFDALVDQETFEKLTSIQESAIIQAKINGVWENIMVEQKEYKRAKATLQHFNITISYER